MALTELQRTIIGIGFVPFRPVLPTPLSYGKLTRRTAPVIMSFFKILIPISVGLTCPDNLLRNGVLP